MEQVIVTTTSSVGRQLVVQMVKWLVDYFYMPDDGRDQYHKVFCVKCGLIIIAIGVPVIIACWQ